MATRMRTRSLRRKACREVYECFLDLILDFFGSVGDLERVGVVNKTMNRIVAAEGRIRLRVVARFFDMLDASPERLREVVATRGPLLKALIIESNLKPDFFRAIRDVKKCWQPRSVDAVAFGTDHDEMHEINDKAAYDAFLDHLVLAIVCSSDLMIDDFDDSILVQAGESTFYFDYYNSRMPLKLLSTVVPKLAGLTKLEIRLNFNDGVSTKHLKLHELGLDTLRLSKACTHHFKKPNADNWRVKVLLLDQLKVTESRDYNDDADGAITIPQARRFRFVHRVVVDLWPENFITNVADMRTVLGALFPLAASHGNLDMTNTDDQLQKLRRYCFC